MNLFSGDALALLDLDRFAAFRSLDSWRDSGDRRDRERSRDLEREDAFFSFFDGERESLDLQQKSLTVVRRNRKDGQDERK